MSHFKIVTVLEASTYFFHNFSCSQLLVLFVNDVEYQSTIITLYTSVCNRTLKAVESGRKKLVNCTGLAAL